MELEQYRQVLLLQRLGALFRELGRQGLVPFAARSEGLEALLVGAVGVLGGPDWIYPDARTGWGCALLRGCGMGEHLHQWLGTGQDRALGRAQPGLSGYAAGRVVPVTPQLGLRVRQALGTAWALRSSEEDALCACVLGPSELARPEPLDALLRARQLGAPLLGLIVAPPDLCARWILRLTALEIPCALAAAGDLDAVLAAGRPLAAWVRFERAPAALILEDLPAGPRALEPLEQFAARLHSSEQRAQLPYLRRAVAAAIRESLAEVLGPRRAQQVLAGLGAAWS